MNSILRSASVLTLFAAALAASAQNLVVNGSFETGDFTGFTVTNPDPNLSVRGQNASDGTYAAWFGTGGATSSISQTLPTAAGRSYTVAFDLRIGNTGSGPTNSFVASFGGTTLLSLANQPSNFVYTPYSFTVSGSGSDALTLTGRHDPSYYILDNVRVTAANPTPEPSALAALGVGAVAFVKRRRMG